MRTPVGIDELVNGLTAFRDGLSSQLADERPVPSDLTERLWSVHHTVSSLLEDLRRLHDLTDRGAGDFHLTSDDGFPDRQYEQVDEPLGASAYIVVDNANCLYEPDISSAVRIVPPYGTKVSIVRDQGSWVLIKFCGKNAWSPRNHLSASLAPSKPASDVGVVPLSNYTFRPPPIHNASTVPEVEYGPRGGRFIRTLSGFRRYL